MLYDNVCDLKNVCNIYSVHSLCYYFLEGEMIMTFAEIVEKTRCKLIDVRGHVAVIYKKKP